ncbi:MAG: hypothetical protein CMJ06_02555 [Pelagibacterales bacterium]|nr:hypothetical protein [Pelagibacterales bacterium]OUU62933.1 MAG: hypothetical protein CBC22_02535 [Alphaproteobacteria bacterium TMED62]|tara:strand:+ start:2696 stop:3502 length:807 start_codon:yes stop_codon:yes gene_type:complete
MIIKISHKTKYFFENTVPRLIQTLKLYPTSCKNQKVLEWNISSNKGEILNSYQDSLGHNIINIYIKNLNGQQEIKSEGRIQTKNFFGTFFGLSDKVNPLCFLRHTNLTYPGKNIVKLSNKIKKKSNLIEFCHYLNLVVSEAIRYKSNTTNNNTSAEMALEKGEGVCQDYAHILISLSKYFKLPARYVNGYLVEDENTKEYFTHAWVEIYIKDLGWVAFDPSHKKCINEKYVRISCGYDFIDASPIKGIKLNYMGSEELSYKVDVNSIQ